MSAHETAYEAMSQGDMPQVKTLLEDIDVNITDEEGYTLLHMAATFGYKEVAELLISKGANVNAQDARGFAPLHCAAVSTIRNVNDLEMLKGIGLGHYSAVVALLVAKGANANTRNTSNHTPLDLANANGHEAAAALLSIYTN